MRVSTHASCLTEMKHSSVSDEESTLLSDPRWSLVQRIIRSPGLARSNRLSDLLSYVARKALTGKTHEIREQQIGVNVFGRPSDYNPAEDNIVRSHARLLRQRLDAFYAGEGSSEIFHLTVPKGGYLPVFVERGEQLPDRSADDNDFEVATGLLQSAGPVETKLPRAAGQTGTRSRLLLLAGLIAALLIALWLWASYQRGPAAAARSSHFLWSNLFQHDRSTLVVVADSALVMYENLTKQAVSLNDYITRRYLSSEIMPANSELAREVNGLSGRRYTSFVDLNLIARLSRLPDVVPDRLRIAYARDLGLDSFKQSNVIISGAIEANPWLSLYENRLNFIMRDDLGYTFRITNKHPAAGELSSYTYNTSKPSQDVYAIVAYVPARESVGNALIIEGTTTAGTEGAADFILDEAAMAPVIARAILPDGSLGGFEVLLQTRNMAGSAPPATVVSTHFTDLKQH